VGTRRSASVNRVSMEYRKSQVHELDEIPMASPD
jgi:hypothetical protein